MSDFDFSPDDLPSRRGSAPRPNRDRYLDPDGDPMVWPIVRDIGLCLMALIALGMWGCPNYNAWKASLTGKAELSRAEYNRRIAVLEAQAKLDSAKMFADAEVVRAQGVAKANEIIGAGLKGNEEYLRYLWIQGLQTDKGQVVYVPTEAGLPILEAGAGRLQPASVEKD